MPDTGRRFQKSANGRQDWVFMTPAEIMGVAPEQISRTPKRDANGQLENLSPMERYLERQSPAARLRNKFARQPASVAQFLGSGQRSKRTAITMILPTRSTAVWMTCNRQRCSTNFRAARRTTISLENSQCEFALVKSTWQFSFGMRHPIPHKNGRIGTSTVPAIAQPGHGARHGSDDGAGPDNFPGRANHRMDSDSTEPLANPIGASFAPLSSGIARPIGLTPLPGITRPASMQTPTTPAWAPQPAPWTSTTPQPFAIPQRKF